MSNDSCARRTRKATYVFYKDEPNILMKVSTILTSTGITGCDIFRLMAIFRGDNLEKMRFDYSKGDGLQIILYTSI